MKPITSPSSLAWTAFSAAAVAAALPPGDPNAARAAATATPTVYLAGDSTMAEQGGKNGTEGWGHYLQYSLSIPVVNKAFAGRSARSFTDQGRFAAIEAAVVPGDFGFFTNKCVEEEGNQIIGSNPTERKETTEVLTPSSSVIIEFGHNDGGGAQLGTVNYTDNGRPAYPGQGDETCVSFYNGTEVVVHTYNWYMLRAARSFLARGASVVVSTMTPTNPWETGKFSYTPPIFVGYAENVAGVLEEDVEGEAAFVNHGRYEADAFRRLGKEVVDGFFLMDHTHTQPEGADAAAKAFVKGLKCGRSELSGFVVNATEEIPGVCL